MTQDEIKLQPHKMVNGIAVLLTESEIAELSYVSEEQAAIILKNFQTSKISVIKTSRDIFLNLNITVSTGTYKGTQTAKNLFCNAVNGRTAIQYPLNWRLSDDVTWVSLSKDEAYELSNAFEAQEVSGYRQETNFIIQVNNATTLEEVNSIVIEFK